MQVKTQPFKGALELKNDGISFDVYGNGSKRLGDLSVTKSGLIWSKDTSGKTARENSIVVKWEEFINWVQSRRAAATHGAASRIGPQGNGATKVSAPASNHSAARPSTKQMSSPASKQSAPRSSALKMPAPANKLSPQSTFATKTAPQSGKPSAGKPFASKPFASKPSASKPSAGKLSSSPNSSIKVPSQAGKLAAQRATAMKLSARKLAAAKSSAAASSAAKSSEANAAKTASAKPASLKTTSNASGKPGAQTNSAVKPSRQNGDQSMMPQNKAQSKVSSASAGKSATAASKADVASRRQAS